ncbi:PepSY-like domain-containing protein [Mucilaginibacter sp. AW1-3]
MKKVLILISIFSLGFGFYAKAQYIGTDDLPADITQDFSAKYPNMTKVDWEKDGKHYKATFSVDQCAHQLVYDQNGKMIAQQFGLPVSSLPADVFNGLKKNFPELKIAEVAQLEEKGKVSYKLSLTDDSSSTEKVFMTPDGRVIRTIIDQQ